MLEREFANLSRNRVRVAHAVMRDAPLVEGDPYRRQSEVSLANNVRRLVLIRHGESRWNNEQRFTGWADVGLTDAGKAQMRAAARAMHEAGVTVDLVFASVLRRSIESQWILLDAMDRTWVPQVLDWRLNERHYGALTGRSKAQAELEHGKEAVLSWRRSYDAMPPPMDAVAATFVPLDGRYLGLAADRIPVGESLRQTVARVNSVWHQRIAPALKTCASVAVVAHGNSLRALIKIIESLSESEIANVEVNNAEPLVYELNAACRPLRKRRLEVGIAKPSEIL